MEEEAGRVASWAAWAKPRWLGHDVGEWGGGLGGLGQLGE
jgi:hypothetical protein